jgi:hypothetical protein
VKQKQNQKTERNIVKVKGNRQLRKEGSKEGKKKWRNREVKKK